MDGYKRIALEELARLARAATDEEIQLQAACALLEWAKDQHAKEEES
jgi:hypothetical protein